MDVTCIGSEAATSHVCLSGLVMCFGSYAGRASVIVVFSRRAGPKLIVRGFVKNHKRKALQVNISILLIWPGVNIIQAEVS